MRVIGAGDLDEQVTILTATAARDVYGAETLTWANGATVWAQVRERGGREPLLADRPVMVVAYEVTIRTGVTVTHLDRLAWGDKTLQIETVTPQRATGLIVLRCLEIDA